MIAGIFAAWELVIILAVLFLIPFSLALTAFWIWMLVDCLKNTTMQTNEKVGWVLAIVFTHWLGALIYFLAGRDRTPIVTAPPPPQFGVPPPFAR